MRKKDCEICDGHHRPSGNGSQASRSRSTSGLISSLYSRVLPTPTHFPAESRNHRRRVSGRRAHGHDVSRTTVSGHYQTIRVCRISEYARTFEKLVSRAELTVKKAFAEKRKISHPYPKIEVWRKIRVSAVEFGWAVEISPAKIYWRPRTLLK